MNRKTDVVRFYSSLTVVSFQLDGSQEIKKYICLIECDLAQMAADAKETGIFDYQRMETLAFNFIIGYWLGKTKNM